MTTRKRAAVANIPTLLAILILGLVLGACASRPETAAGDVNLALVAKVKTNAADGRPLTGASQGAPVARGGEWPFYASLYGGKGSVIGWLTFVTNSPTESLGGLASWSKPASAVAKTYTNGFLTESWLIGSTYLPSATNRVFSFSNGAVQFTGGNVPSSPVLFNVGLTAGNTTTDTNGTAFSMSITKANGLFSGTFIPPGMNTSLAFRGAVLQQRDHGSGFFLNRNVSGRVEVGPAP